jgi:aryl-alcohol dehydrogenase-like predicted oxidoreductase
MVGLDRRQGVGLRLGLGLLSIGRVWGVARSAPPSESQAHALLAKAVELGIETFDTAPAYADSESRLGRFLAHLDPGRREKLVVMTKAGEHWDQERGASFVDHREDALRRSIDRSLERLGSISLLQIHKATRDVVAHPDVAAAIDHAKSCGVTSFGASVSDVEAGMAALDSGLYQAVQFPLNLANASMLPLLPALEARGATAIINRPFAMGGLMTEQNAEEAAVSAFGFLEKHVRNGIVLTGTGRIDHLTLNVTAFHRRRISPVS